MGVILVEQEGLLMEVTAAEAARRLWGKSLSRSEALRRYRGKREREREKDERERVRREMRE